VQASSNEESCIACRSPHPNTLFGGWMRACKPARRMLLLSKIGGGVSQRSMRALPMHGSEQHPHRLQPGRPLLHTRQSFSLAVHRLMPAERAASEDDPKGLFARFQLRCIEPSTRRRGERRTISGPSVDSTRSVMTTGPERRHCISTHILQALWHGTGRE